MVIVNDDHTNTNTSRNTSGHWAHQQHGICDAEDDNNQSSEHDDDHDHGRNGLISYLVHRHFLNRLENNGEHEETDGEDTMGNEETNLPPTYEDAIKDEAVATASDDE